MDDIIPAPTLDTRTGASLEPSRRAEVFSGTVGRRRSWSFEQKLAIVVEAEKSDSLSELARRHDIRTSQLYTWRRELRYALHAKRPGLAVEQQPMFVPIVEDSDGLPLRAPNNGMAIEVEMSAGVLRISRSADIALVQAVIDALRAER